MEMYLHTVGDLYRGFMVIFWRKKEKVETHRDFSQIIKLIRYDTKKSTLIAWCRDTNWKIRLYKGTNKNYFTVSESFVDKPRSSWYRIYVTPLSDDSASDWLYNHKFYTDLQEIFGTKIEEA